MSRETRSQVLFLLGAVACISPWLVVLRRLAEVLQ